MLNAYAQQSLKALLGKDQVFTDMASLFAYEVDAGLDRGMPDGVVLPQSAEDVALVTRWAAEHAMPLIGRGAGTGLSGGAVAEHGGLILEFSRMNRVLEIDVRGRTALVEPGLINLRLDEQAREQGLYFPPDPASQRASTIGGNVSENSGGPHCLYYGVTANHVLGVEAVFADGTVAWVGGDAPDRVGLDLLGLLVGSEGTLATITRVKVKLLPLPEAVVTLMAAFPTIEAASLAVSDVIGHQIVPAALEMMDQVTIGAVEAAYRAGYPTDAGAVLLVDVDGLEEGCDELAGAIREILERNEAFNVRRAADAAERDLLWAGRKGAIGALGRIRPNYYLHDGVVPRTRLPEVLHRVSEIGKEYDLPVANVFHAGDGNLHPNILFDLRDQGALDRVEEAGEHMLRAVVDSGGTLSGEHGIGIEKNAFMPWIYGPDDLDAMHRVKAVLDPEGRLNPGKIFPDSDPDQPNPKLRARVGLAAEARWW